MSKIFTALLLSFSVGLSGCATGYLLDHYVGDDVQYKKVSEDDQMLAIGQTQTNQGKTGLLFFGEKYSYFVTRNGEQLTAIINNIPADQRLLTTALPIQFNVRDTTKFSGVLHFRYATPLNDIDTNTLKKLETLGFIYKENIREQNNSVIYLKAILPFEGEIYQAVAPSQIQHKLSKPYAIRLEQNIREVKANEKKSLGLILAPLAITFDVITLPVALVATPLVIGYEITQPDAWK